VIPDSLYLPGTSLLHRLHPLTRLIFSLAAVVITFGGPGPWLSAILPGLLALLILWWAGLAWRAMRMIFRLLAPLAVMLFLIHGLFNPQNQTILLRVGFLAVGQEGLLFAGLILTRLAAALAASLVLVMSTHPAHLMKALTDAGLPYTLAYLLGSPLLLLPQLAGRVHKIRTAQQARGMETRGNLLKRIRALFPLVAPLVYSALVDVEDRSLALEVRGFNAPNPKTSLIDLPDSPAQRVGRWGMILVAGLLLVAGLWERANGGH
jgi:energy-coupling factor transport system permease protein